MLYPRSRPSAISSRARWMRLLTALAAVTLAGAACSLGADLDTGPIEELRCERDEDCSTGSVCNASGYCDPPPDAADTASATCMHTRCDSLCVDLQNDARHCGACGNRCDGDEVCEEGGCVCNGELCNGTCVDLATNTRHCGACGNDCPEDAICQGGACSCESSSELVCDDECTRVSSDGEHCGACDVRCASGSDCRSGECRCAGHPNGDLCIANAPGVATAFCNSQRTCLLTCLDGMADCNGDPADGCEALAPCP